MPKEKDPSMKLARTQFVAYGRGTKKCFLMLGNFKDSFSINSHTFYSHSTVENNISLQHTIMKIYIYILKHQYLGTALYNLNQDQESIECFDKAISINPKLFQVWYNKGNALRNLNQYQEAIKCYDQAISINPKDDFALENNGLMLHELQKYMDALSNFEQALKINTDALRYKFKADSLFELRRKSEAKYFYFTAQELGLGQNAYIQSQLLKL